MNIELIIIGLVVGVLVGMTGVGGASLLTPILIFMGIDPKTAIGTDFIYNSVTKAIGATQHIRQKTVDFTLVKHLAAGSIPAALLANLLFYRVISDQVNEGLLTLILGIVLIVTSLATLYQTFIGNTQSTLKEKSLKEKKALILIGSILIGAVVGMTSIGAGSLFALFILYSFNISSPKLVGTDLMLAFLLSTLTGIFMAHHGHVDYTLAMNLLFGSIPGAVIGSHFTIKIQAKYIKLLIVTFILISGMLLIYKAF